MNLASCFADVPHPGELIREEMEARGWSQRDLAFILGVPEQSVSPIMTGKRNVTPEMAKALGHRTWDPELLRKLPRQADISKVELSACRMRYSAGVSPPRESWGLSSL